MSGHGHGYKDCVPLQMAVTKENVEIVEMILQHPNIVVNLPIDNYGNTVYSWAKNNKKVKDPVKMARILRMLEDAGARMPKFVS